MKNTKSEDGFPILFIDKKDCCGCGLCCISCPADAISMNSDFEGFMYPFVNTEKCIKCLKCIKICVFRQT